MKSRREGMWGATRATPGPRVREERGKRAIFARASGVASEFIPSRRQRGRWGSEPGLRDQRGGGGAGAPRTPPMQNPKREKAAAPRGAHNGVARRFNMVRFLS